MIKNKFVDSVSLFETGLSAAEWAWRIITLVFIGSGATVTGFMAKADPILNKLGPVYWVGIGILTALLLTLILYLVKSAILKQSQADYHASLSVPKNSVNPLLDSFTDTIIPLEDLRLPTIQLHEHKHFKRCKFVGPGAVAILGGNYVNSGFKECGDVVALPADVYLTGIVVLKNCTVESCEFIRTTVLVDQNSAKGFVGVPGISIKGIA
ncbi:hypothetical protein [Vibrio lentus]|uniref:hypothetical protein n=1 Tax=Vibrio lentus TaxID=136468 RepID=UPI001055CD2D|nr:hypothetical protein [Vibrio lentus]